MLHQKHKYIKYIWELVAQQMFKWSYRILTNELHMLSNWLRIGKLQSNDKMEKLVPINGRNHLVRSVIHYIWRQSAHAHVTKKLIAITRVCAPSVSPPGALHLGDTGPWRTSAVGARRHWRGEAGGLLTADWHNLDSCRYSVVTSASGRSDAVTCLQPPGLVTASYEAQINIWVCVQRVRAVPPPSLEHRPRKIFRWPQKYFGYKNSLQFNYPAAP